MQLYNGQGLINSYSKYKEFGERSNKKLVILHGEIAKYIKSKLGETFSVKSLGFGNGKESKIKGRYSDKNVDITVLKDDKPIAGIGVKFVMQNYSQNSVNYFENMLGETANIRSNKIAYFQIFVIPEIIPYYKQGGVFKNWETFSLHNAKKYLILSKDDIDTFVHTPTKTLLYVVSLPEIAGKLDKKIDYVNYYNSIEELTIQTSKKDFGNFESSVIFNNYELFIEKIIHYIKSI